MRELRELLEKYGNAINELNKIYTELSDTVATITDGALTVCNAVAGTRVQLYHTFGCPKSKAIELVKDMADDAYLEERWFDPAQGTCYYFNIDRQECCIIIHEDEGTDA